MTKTILITNDDGIHSPGLQALKSALTSLGRIIIVAPDRDNSAISHALTMDRPLHIQPLTLDTYCVNGTPTDCVALGLNKILEAKPDLLVSGINQGPNLGDDISYSGTVSAAIEGTMYSIPSLAISTTEHDAADFTAAQKIIHLLSSKVMNYGLPADTLMNINVPGTRHIKGVKVTRQGRRRWQQAVQEITDPRGRTLYWIGGGTPLLDGGSGTDVEAIDNNCISVTPIHLDLTNHEGISYFKQDLGIEDASPF